MILQTVYRESTETVTSSGLNPVDWFIGMVFVLSVVSGFLRGLLRSLLSLAGLVVAVIVAAIYAPRLAPSIAAWVSPAALAKVIAFFLIVMAVVVAVSLLGRLLKRAVQGAGLGFFDRMGGAAFGAARAIVFLAAITLPLVPLIPRFSWTRESVLLPYLLQAAHGISFVLPRDFVHHIEASP